MSQDSDGEPNVVLLMTDDQGWGDVKYNGHPSLRTPNLDAMAASGLRFERFYAAAPVCSPTRGSCLTGRHPFRYGVFGANQGHMRRQEVTLAEALRAKGFTTGHFGKWHLGTLTKKGRDSNRGGARNLQHYSPPWANGFDVCFSTEAKLPTFDPMKTPGKIAGGVGKKRPGDAYGTSYWTGPETRATENLDGDDSRVIMDRVIPFIESAAAAQKPFLAVVWFHAPHLPVVAGEKHLEMYADESGRKQHYLGCISAIDDQIGRLRLRLRKLGIADNTMVWFCSDNGPEGNAGAPGSAGGLRGRKRSLWEGGVRVPGLLEWPARIERARTTAIPCSTSDYFPTIMDIVGGKAANPLDGVSLLPLIAGKMKRRPLGIGFESRNRVAWIDNRYKLVREGKTAKLKLYDLEADPGETRDLAKTKPEVFSRLQANLASWRASCKRSLAGADYK
jgi:arylsulfatase